MLCKRWLAICFVAGFTAAAWGQDKPTQTKPGADKPAIAPTVESLRLKLPQLAKTDMSDISRLRNGDLDFQLADKPRQELLQRITQYYIFRLTHEVPLYTTATGPDSLREHVNAFVSRVLPFARAVEGGPETNPEQTRRIRQYASELARASVPAFQKVLQDPRAVVRMNAMRMAYLFAERGIGEIYPVLLYPLEKYPKDAAAEFQAERYWAIRAFGELFHIQATNTDPKRTILPPEVTAKAAGLIYDWSQWAYRIDPELVKTWGAEEQDGLRYMRRQAVRTLALLRRPLVNSAKPQEGRIAELFWQIMNNDSAAKLSPSPSWSERVEAAAGLLALYPEPKGPYQADWAYHQVGRFVVDMITAANADPEGREFWQHYAAYLRARIAEVQRILGEPKHPAYPLYAKADYIRKLLPLMSKPLEELSRSRPQDVAARVKVDDLEKFLETNPPKADELFVIPKSSP